MQIAVGCACVISSVTIKRKPENPFLAIHKMGGFCAYHNAIKFTSTSKKKKITGEVP